MSRLYIGLAGLASDQATFHEKLKFRLAMYNLREERDIKPASFGKLVSTLLYEKRCAAPPSKINRHFPPRSSRFYNASGCPESR